jgi:hypothetical protein
MEQCIARVRTNGSNRSTEVMKLDSEHRVTYITVVLFSRPIYYEKLFSKGS